MGVSVTPPTATASLDTPNDRRDPSRQEPQPEGLRATDPRLTTRDCADRLGVSTGFIIGEIRDGRLAATLCEREGKRTIYRIAPADFEAYQRRHWTAKRTAS